MNGVDTPRQILLALVDDHVIFKKGMRIAMGTYKNVQILFEADNGLHLLEHLTKHTPDVILLDLQMGVMDGVEALKEVRRLHPSVKVVIMSLNISDTLINELTSLGADAYLSKTADPQTMYNTILKVLDS
ncbi:MAG: response regulator transcription factor [Chitinophagaceae bacterium]